MGSLGSTMSATELGITEEFPAIAALTAAVFQEWPEHEKFVQKSLAAANGDFLIRLEDVAAHTLTLTGGDLPRYAADYRWMCNILLEEQLHFARYKRER